jgi:hypothetical protein
MSGNPNSNGKLTRTLFDIHSRRTECTDGSDRLVTAMTYLGATKITVVSSEQLIRALERAVNQ